MAGVRGRAVMLWGRGGVEPPGPLDPLFLGTSLASLWPWEVVLLGSGAASTTVAHTWAH